MDKYLELMILVQQYLNYSDVDSNLEIISAYDLIELLNSDLQELRETVDREVLNEKINKIFNLSVTTKRFLLKKITANFGYSFNKEKHGYLITDFLECITNMFDALEKYSTRYQSNIELSNFGKSPTTEEQKFSDGFLDISIKFGIGFIITASITVSKNADPEDIFKREWSNRITIADFIKENKKSILKKIPIFVQDLNPVFVSIIQEAYNKSVPKL